MRPDPKNPQVGDVFIDEGHTECTVVAVGVNSLGYVWADEDGQHADLETRAFVAGHWKPPTPCMGVELVNGKRMAWHTDEETMRDEYPHAVRIGPARVVFVEDEQ